MTNSLTECATTNCCSLCGGCGCSHCGGINIADVPNKSPISSNTTLLGTDSFGYTVGQIAQFVSLNKGVEVVTEISADQNQVSNVNAYIASATLNLNLMAAANANRSLWVFSLSGGGAVTINTDGGDLINGSASATVTAGESMLIYPYSAGWVGIKVALF